MTVSAPAVPASHDLPAGLGRPPPRRVRYKAWRGAVILWVFRSFAIPLLALAAPLFWYTVISFGFLLGAEPVKARVTVLKASSHGRLAGSLHYEYTDPAGVVRAGSTGLRSEEYDAWERDLAGRVRGRPPPGGPDLRPEIWVRAIDVGPIHYSKPMNGKVIYWCGTPPASCLLGFTVVGWFISCAVVYVTAYHSPRAERRLMRHGLAVRGRLVARGGERAPTSPFEVEYHFETAPGTVVRGKMTVGSGHQNRTAPGTWVTVLYDPRRPSRNLVYEFAEFFAVAR